MYFAIAIVAVAVAAAIDAVRAVRAVSAVRTLDNAVAVALCDCADICAADQLVCDSGVRLNGVAHQHGDRHRTDAAGHGRHERRHLLDLGVGNVADKPLARFLRGICVMEKCLIIRIQRRGLCTG